MTQDIVFDTHVLTEFIAQYFERRLYEQEYVIAKGNITLERAKIINKILKEFYNEGIFTYGLIVTSIISYIEIARKFDKVSMGRYTILQLKSFIDEHPPYLINSPIELSLSYFLSNVPKSVNDGKEEKRIELADAIHCATYLSRDNALLFTEDSKIKEIPRLNLL